MPVSDHSTEKQIDPDLARLVALWPRLPKADKRAILEIAERAERGAGQ
jgi:hypothetical protein